MKFLNRISSISLVGFSIIILSSSIKLGIGRLQNPGPGFMPFVASIILFSLSLVVLGRGLDRSSLVEGSTISWKIIVRPVSLVIVLSVYTFLLIIFGYLISTFVLMFLMFVICDPKRWLMHIVSSTIVVNLTFLLFHKWLGVQLPSGILRISW